MIERASTYRDSCEGACGAVAKAIGRSAPAQGSKMPHLYALGGFLGVFQKKKPIKTIWFTMRTCMYDEAIFCRHMQNVGNFFVDTCKM